jgi:alginate O-acetyltransferase complex protein AlgI
MSFASLTFFLFCCLAFGLHYAVRRRWWQNTVLIVASYAFYAWWDYRFCSLMLISSAVDYIAGRGIHGSARPGVRKAYLALSLACNLGMLGFFKYAGFFVESFNDLDFTIQADISLGND